MKYRVIDQDHIEVFMISPWDGKENSKIIKATDRQIREFINGYLVQNVFPDLTADEREFLVSGATAEDWKKMFGDEDE